jgi:magnesium transporter
MKFTRKPEKYLRYIIPPGLLGTERTRRILSKGPIEAPQRKDAEQTHITAYDYNGVGLEEHTLQSIEETYQFKDNGRVTWINIDGIRKGDVEKISTHFDIHPLITEDILSMNQRPKMDEVDGVLYCLLNMLYFNEIHGGVEQEQISIVLGRDFVITFQEDPQRDVLNPLRERLRLTNSKLRQRTADYLCYTMLDLIVDSYLNVIERVGERIENLEEEVVRRSNTIVLARINGLRKELIILKRNIAPVRDLVVNIIRSESDLLEESTTKYFKDVHDHIVQAYDLSDNYRDVMLTLQDLYFNNINMKTNEAMKVIAIVTCLLAPATVIGGIFGMNFDVIPTAHNEWGFFTAVGAMLLIPIFMLVVFKRRGWF